MTAAPSADRPIAERRVHQKKKHPQGCIFISKSIRPRPPERQPGRAPNLQPHPGIKAPDREGPCRPGIPRGLRRLPGPKVPRPGTGQAPSLPAYEGLPGSRVVVLVGNDRSPHQSSNPEPRQTERKEAGAANVGPLRPDGPMPPSGPPEAGNPLAGHLPRNKHHPKGRRGRGSRPGTIGGLPPRFREFNFKQTSNRHTHTHQQPNRQHQTNEVSQRETPTQPTPQQRCHYTKSESRLRRSSRPTHSAPSRARARRRQPGAGR